jgi:SAM-dependent methyltransferase
MLRLLKRLKKRYTPWYRADYKKFLQMNKGNGDFEISDSFPCLRDKNTESGIFSGHYLQQDLYMARQVFESKSLKHVDVGSRIDGFVTHVAMFREIEVFDIRPLHYPIRNLIFRQADLMNIPDHFIAYADSVSCLHTLEHFGLGRYGDKIDPHGHFKGFDAITSILKRNGIFYFSVPLGPSRIEFNAHRIFSLSYLVNWVTDQFDIVKFAYIDDQLLIHEDIPLTKENIDTNCGCHHGCALFVLKRK